MIDDLFGVLPFQQHYLTSPMREKRKMLVQRDYYVGGGDGWGGSGWGGGAGSHSKRNGGEWGHL